MTTALHLAVVMVLTEIASQLKLDRLKIEQLPVDLNTTLTDDFEDFSAHLDLEVAILYATEIHPDQTYYHSEEYRNKSNLYRSCAVSYRYCGYLSICLSAISILRIFAVA